MHKAIYCHGYVPWWLWLVILVACGPPYIWIVLKLAAIKASAKVLLLVFVRMIADVVRVTDGILGRHW